MADEAGVRIDVQPIPATIHADPDRMIQVLTNLLSNAIKFSRSGTDVGLRAIHVQSGRVRIEVRDHGRGIPADQLERVFERFRQVEAGDARDKGGSGLGLPISRSIVEQHGGRIWAEARRATGPR